MTINYTEIHGRLLETRASDPAPGAIVTGDVWYNSTAEAVKYVGFSAGGWATDGTFNTGRTEGAVMAGEAPASIAVGSSLSPGSPLNQITEEYNGSTWSSQNSLNTDRGRISGTGTQTAFMVVSGGGLAPPYSQATEEYDGTNWTSVNNIPTGNVISASSGIQTAALRWGGYTGPTTGAKTDASFEYDGTNWTSAPNYPQITFGSYGAGPESATVSISGGGTPAGQPNITAEYNGSTWSTNPATYPQDVAYTGWSGNDSDALIFGGSAQPGSSTVDVMGTWNGTAYSTSPLVTPVGTRSQTGNKGSGSSNGFSYFISPSPATQTYDFTTTPFQTVKTVTTS